MAPRTREVARGKEGVREEEKKREGAEREEEEEEEQGEEEEREQKDKWGRGGGSAKCLNYIGENPLGKDSPGQGWKVQSWGQGIPGKD